VSLPSEPQLLPAALDAPARPQRVRLVKRRPRRHVLAGQTPNRRHNVVLARARIGSVFGRLLLPLRRDLRQPELPRIPPVQLRRIVNASVVEPLLVAQPRDEVDVRVLLLDFEDGRQTEMVVVVVRDDDNVNERDVFDIARHRGVSRRTDPGRWRAAPREDGVEEYAQTRRELNKVAGMTEPCRAQSGSLASW